VVVTHPFRDGAQRELVEYRHRERGVDLRADPRSPERGLTVSMSADLRTASGPNGPLDAWAVRCLRFAIGEAFTGSLLRLS
jgi:hypothetical protein